MPTVVAQVTRRMNLHRCNLNRFKQLSIMCGIVKTQCPYRSRLSDGSGHIKNSAAAMKKIFSVGQTTAQKLRQRGCEKRMAHRPTGMPESGNCEDVAARCAPPQKNQLGQWLRSTGWQAGPAKQADPVSRLKTFWVRFASRRKNAPEPYRRAQRHRPSKAIQIRCADLQRHATRYPSARSGTTTAR